MELTEIIKSAPKVLLHDHLDGSLRPSTVVELAEKHGFAALPTKDADELGAWFHKGADTGNLPQYLKGFAFTCGVMQTKEALSRVAYEMLEDRAKDGVCYVETRFSPVFHTSKGLYHDEIVEAVLNGLEEGSRKFNIGYGLLICGMRNMTNTLEMAELAVNFRNKGVVGFDLAGEEGGYPPKKHIEAFQFCQRENFSITIHAGEAFGKESIWQAIQWCGAHRIGHGTRILDDITFDPKTGEIISMGDLAQYILDKRIPIEICLVSNLHTGAIKRLEEHPFGILYKNKFRVCLNTDNTLMSNTSMSNEFLTAIKYFNVNLDDLEKLTINAMKSAFIHHNERLKFIYDVIKPGYQKLREELTSLRN